MKAKLRKEQIEKTKANLSNFQMSTSENKSQENNNNNQNNQNQNQNNQNQNNQNQNQNNQNQAEIKIKRRKNRVQSAEVITGIFHGENINKYSNLVNSKKFSVMQFQSNPMNIINKEELKEQELSRIAAMFNFEVDKEKDVVKIQENDEYYDMRNQINELKKELDNKKEEYNNLITKYDNKIESEKQEIGSLENKLKEYVEYDIEKVKKDNIILAREINLLDKKYDSLNALYKKEKYEINEVTLELDNLIRKLKGEINFVDDLKMRLKSLTNKDISQELFDSINYILKDNITPQIKNTPSHSNIGSVRSRTGNIPIADILDDSSLDSKESIKKLYI